MSSQSRPDSLGRMIAGLTAGVAGRPRAVLAVVLCLTVLSAVAASSLDFHTQRNDLLGPDRPCQKRWQKYLDAFGDDDDMIVVAEGSDPAAMRAALDAVAERVNRRPDLFDRVFYRVDLRHLRDRGLLYLPPEELQAVAARLDPMGPLLGPVGAVAWRMLSLQSLLGDAVRALAAAAGGRELTPAERSLLAQLPSVVSAAAAAVGDPDRYRNPWTLTSSPAAGRPRAEEAFTTAQYLFTPDGSLALFTCRPKKVAASFTPAREASAALRTILSDVAKCHPGVTLGLTGLPVLETDEMELSDADSTRAAWLALVGVAGLYFVVYRKPRYPLLTLATLVVGTVWALGWAAVTVGHLNILSAAFAVMLIGLGDYGVLWVARYDEARGRGQPVSAALRLAAVSAGPSIVTAAATTGLAFFAVMLADFKAVAELGWIAGCGILLCAASCLLLMPALLSLVDGRTAPAGAAVGAGGGVGNPPQVLRFAAVARPSGWLAALADRPRPVLGIGAALVAVGFAGVFRLSYDHNLLNLQPRGRDSVAWERKLIERAAGATWDALSIARSREEALALKARYEAVPEVGKVVEVASLLPADQERKLPVVRSIHARLAGLPPPAELPPPVGSDPVAVRDLLTRLARLSHDGALTQSLASLARALDSSADAADRLRAFDRRMASDLAEELHQLKAVSRPVAVTLDDVPGELRERYVGAGGEFLVRAFARDSLWDYEALERFTAVAAAADPEATGKAFRTLEGLRQMKRGFERAAAYALVAIVLVLLLDLRHLGEVLLALFPLAVGAVLTLGVMGWCGVSLNPANMIALPLIIGVGVDNGVHVLHDFRGRDRRQVYRLGAATGRGVLVAGLTTVLGFGTLMTARHAGLASLGLALALGVGLCMAAALVLLPAVLRLLDLRRRGREPARRWPPPVTGSLPRWSVARVA